MPDEAERIEAAEPEAADGGEHVDRYESGVEVEYARPRGGRPRGVGRRGEDVRRVRGEWKFVGETKAFYRYAKDYKREALPLKRRLYELVGSIYVGKQLLRGGPRELLRVELVPAGRRLVRRIHRPGAPVEFGDDDYRVVEEGEGGGNGEADEAQEAAAPQGED